MLYDVDIMYNYVNITYNIYILKIIFSFEVICRPCYARDSRKPTVYTAEILRKKIEDKQISFIKW